LADDQGRVGEDSESEERALFARYATQRDEESLDALVRRFLPLAQRLAQRYAHLNEPLDDLVQVASLALVKAIQRFDTDRGTAFASYAIPSILGELKRHFRDHGWDLHVPRGMQERVLRIDSAISRLSGKLGRAPSAKELASELGIGIEEVLEAIEASQAYSTRSLDAPLPGEDGERESLAALIGAEDESFDLVEYRHDVQEALEVLPERERRILHLRFVEELTQQEIGERIGISQMHVSRLLRASLVKLREAADPDAAPREKAG
jgi:RNA polymerase sigma-B factor